MKDIFLSEDIVNIYHINSNIIKDSAHLLGILNEEEYKRYKQYLFVKTKKEFLLGRCLLKTVIGNYLNQRPERITFKKNDHGKLFLDEKYYQNRINMNFNLSHSGGIVVAAFVLGNDIGVDIEMVDGDIPEIVERFFSQEEKQYVGNGNRYLSYQIWTLKESYIKAKGYGLNMRLDSFSVFDDLGVFFYTTYLLNDYCLSIAVITPENKQYGVKFHELTRI